MTPRIGELLAAAERLRPARLLTWLPKISTGPDRRRTTGDVTPSDGDPTDTSVTGVVRRLIGGRLAMLLVLSLSIHVLSLAVPVFVLQVYDRVVPHAGYQTLIGLTLLVLMALAFDFVLRQARSRLIQLVTVRVDVAISRRVFAKLAALPLRDLESWSQARWRTLLRDGETVRDTVAGPTTVLLVDLPFILLFLLVIWVIAGPVAWLLLTMIPVFLAMALASSVLVDRASASEQDAAQQRDALVGQLVTGRGPLKALGMTATLRGRWEQLQSRLILQSVTRGSRVDAFSHLATQAALLTTVLMTCFGALAIINQQLTIGGLIAANMLAARVVQPLTRTVGVWRGISRFRRSVRRLDELFAHQEEAEESALQHDRPAGDIRLENVTFRFDNTQRPILEGVNLAVRRGLHGIAGANGSGKTTLLKIMQSLYRPEQGRVLLDGGDIAQFGRQDLARWIGFVPQDLFFVDGTIRDTIARSREDVSDEAVQHAGRLSGAHAFITKLPDGYGAEIGEAGARFSAGERQMLAIARALVDDPAVLLLDEPTAHLDVAASQSLISQLVALGRERTVLVVSHSTAVLEACSTLMVLDGGRIAYSGRASDVLARLTGSPARDASARPATLAVA